MAKKNCGLKLIFTIIAMMSLLTCCIGCKVPTGSQESQKATDFTLYTLTGEKVHLRDLEGKPVVISFWYTGCGACIYQMQFLQAAQTELEDKVVFIEIDIAENSYTVKRCLDYYGINLSVALDSDGNISNAYNIMKTPTNIVIDSTGIIKHRQIGAFRSTNEILTLLSDVK